MSLLRDKIATFFNKELTPFELQTLLKDLESDSAKRTSELVRKRLRQLKRENEKICVTCSKIIPVHENGYTLIFGPEGFQKRANFCAVDCLDYFLRHLNRIDYDGKNKISVEQVGEL